MAPTPLVILGARIFAEEVADLVAQCPEWELAAFCENLERERCDEPLIGRPVVWIDRLPEFASNHEAICALGTNKRSRFVQQAEAAGMRFATVRHPSAVIAPSARVGRGTLAGAGVVVAARTEIGAHVILNRGVLVGHHTRVGDYVTISPGANLAGVVEVGRGAYIGMGAVVLDRIKVGPHAVVGAGAVVTRDVPERVQVQGVPARIVKEGVEGR